MSNTVDQRILEMQFNNKQFENGIQTSLKSLDQLEKGLQLKGAANGLSELDRATKSFSFSHLANSVDFIASKFTGLGILGVTAMKNIADSVYHTSERMVKSLTVDPIMAGFSEYETQINSIQTILANTQKEGTTLTDVTAALDELNRYADKTIYNFTEMTRNIGTFTAAGVKLDTATNSIQGIANLAAISGSTSQQASTAMYQLSQAMASGTVKLMDWNSVVNAGMGGQVFQDALKETAKAHGVAIDDMIKKHGSFRETLSEGWITTEVLTETLEKFTATTEGLTEEQIKANREMWKARGYTEEQIDAIFEMGKTATDAATKVKTFTQLFDTLKEAAQSGWTQSWEILIGDFEEAKALLTAISDEMGGIINASAESRNALLQGWKDAGGRDDVLEGLKNLYGLLKDLIEPARQAFEEMFPPVTVEQLKSYTQRFEDFTKKLKVSPEIADRLKRSFKGFFAVLDIGAQGLSALASGFAKVIGFALPVGGNLLDMTASLGDFLVELSNSIRETGAFRVAMDSIGGAVKFVANMIDKLTSKGADVFKFFESIDLSGIKIKIKPLTDLADVTDWAFQKLQAAYVKALPFLLNAGTYISNMFGGISDSVKDGSLTELAKGGLFASLTVGISKVASGLYSIMKNAGGILENLADVFEGITGALEGMQNKLNAEALKSIATAIAILSGSLVVLSFVDPENVGSSLASITTMFIELIAALSAVTEIASGGKILKAMGSVKVMKGIATAILILAAAMAVLGTLDVDSAAIGLAAILSLMGMLTLVAQKLGDGSVSMMKGASGLIAFSIAVGILSVSVKSLGSMDIESVGKGLLALAGILVGLGAFLKFGNIGAAGISAGIGLMAIATAMLIMGSAIRNMGSMDVGVMSQGLLVMAYSLITLAGAAALLPKNLMSAGVGLMAMATALLIVGAALHIMGSLSIDELIIGIAALAGSLTVMVVAANAMQGSIAGAGAMIIMAGAIVILGAALKIMGSMSVETVATALITLALSLTIIGAAAMLLGPVTPALLMLAGGILALSVAVAVGGAALLVFGAGLTAVGTGIAALVVGIVTAITSLISSIPVLAEQIGAAILAIANAISAGAPACAEAISAVIQAIVDIIVNGVTSIATAVGGVGPAILEVAGMLMALAACSAALAPLAPAIVAVSAALTAFGLGCTAIAGGVTLLAGALALLGSSGVTVASALSDICKVIDRMSKMSLSAVNDSADTFLSAGEKAAKMIIKGLKSGLNSSEDVMSGLVQSMISDANSTSGDFASVGEALANSFSKSMVGSLQNGAENASANMTSAISSMASSITSILTGYYAKFYTVGSTLISKLVAGVNSRKGAARNAASGVGSSMTSALSGTSTSFYSIGVNIVQGLINGINAKKSAAIQAARELANAVDNAARGTLGVQSPSRVFEEIGMWVDMGLANGLIKFANRAANASAYLGESAIQPVMTMTDNMLSDLGSMGSALRGTAALASSLDSSITSEHRVTVNHTFDDLTVKGVNDRNEFVAVANYSVEEMMTELMRKGIRR